MLTRRKPLRSGKGLRTTAKLRRSKRVQPVNRKRKSKTDARNFGEEAARVRAMPCLITGQVPSEPAHVTSRGAGGGRFDLVPLCTVMHLQQHSVGIESFQACHGLDLRAEADRIAVGHPEPLGIRGLARRWASNPLDDVDHIALDEYEREALLGWVRRRMERSARGGIELGEPRERPDLAAAVDLDLELCDDSIESERILFALCDSAGWPS